eukprot:CAMPEP_0183532634 /NCGR_PEP_ID=MMETSP0371-20130417/25662_1 /TAXON_ID=268820 /ORGANISM="Peridinium aciculiferum, Strain PAER-2" /LENGTH=298 /DNA_ID=CAMNT_0025732787 /DNA_START=8 /DNA_END=901 /DNA_ORIENTATION=-
MSNGHGLGRLPAVGPTEPAFVVPLESGAFDELALAMCPCGRGCREKCFDGPAFVSIEGPPAALVAPNASPTSVLAAGTTNQATAELDFDDVVEPQAMTLSLVPEFSEMHHDPDCDQDSPLLLVVDVDTMAGLDVVLMCMEVHVKGRIEQREYFTLNAAGLYGLSFKPHAGVWEAHLSVRSCAGVSAAKTLVVEFSGRTSSASLALADTAALITNKAGGSDTCSTNAGTGSSSSPPQSQHGGRCTRGDLARSSSPRGSTQDFEMDALQPSPERAGLALEGALRRLCSGWRRWQRPVREV